MFVSNIYMYVWLLLESVEFPVILLFITFMYSLWTIVNTHLDWYLEFLREEMYKFIKTHILWKIKIELSRWQAKVSKVSKLGYFILFYLSNTNISE